MRITAKWVQWKTPLELQTYLWLDNALVSLEDLETAEVITLPCPSRTTPPLPWYLQQERIRVLQP
jgi:hypothetical protein